MRRNVHLGLPSGKGIPVLFLRLLFLTLLVSINSGTVPAHAALASTIQEEDQIVTIHVNPVTGSDENSGSAESPYKTLQKALQTVYPGETIKLASGIYQESNETVRGGTPSRPITIEPEDGAIPILDGNSNYLNAIRIVHSYFILRNLEIRNANQGVRLEGVEGVILENNRIHHINNEGIRLRYFASGNTIKNNTIYAGGLDGNGEGIYIGTAPEQRYRNNGEPDTSTHNTIAGNEIYDVEEGIDIKEDSSFNTIAGNTVHNTTNPNSAGINVRADENYIYDNLSYSNAGAGFRFGGDVTYHPIYGDGYQYGINNVLRNNIANDNDKYGYKFINGPQDADYSNAGSGNGRSLYYFGSGVDDFMSETNTMFVDSLNISLVNRTAGRNTFTRAVATITVAEDNNTPVAGAIVEGHWEGITDDAVSAITDAEGQISFKSGSVKNLPGGAAFTFVIDRIAKDGGWIYTSASNGDFNKDGASADTSNSISVP